MNFSEISPAIKYLFNTSNSYCCLPLAGRLCEHVETEESAQVAENCDSELQEYLDTLELTCNGGESEAATLTWTPDFETPNVVYYQVSTVFCCGSTLIQAVVSNVL